MIDSCSNVLRIRRLKFLEALELDYRRVLRLMNYFSTRLGRVFIYRSSGGGEMTHDWGSLVTFVII